MAADARVMIVDDNEDIRESVDMLFQSRNLSIAVAAGGADCLACLGAGFRGVILMDIMMPEMDGWDTIREIVNRGCYEGNVIVMLTGKNEPDCRYEGIQEYVTDYLTKPFNPDELLHAVAYYLSLLEEPQASP